MFLTLKSGQNGRLSTSNPSSAYEVTDPGCPMPLPRSRFVMYRRIRYLYSI